MGEKLIEIISEERRDAAHLLFLTLSNLLDEVDINKQAYFFLDELTRAAIFAGAPLDKVMMLHNRYHDHLQGALVGISNVTGSQLLEEALQEFISLLNLDKTVHQKHSEVIEKVMHYLRANYTRDLKLEEIAQAVNFSTYRLCHIFKEETGMSIGGFLTNQRILEAKYLLTNTILPIKEISIKLGYNDSSYFSRVFKKKTGLLPTDYRQFSAEKVVSLSYTRIIEESASTKSFPMQRIFQNNLSPVMYKFIFF